MVKRNGLSLGSDRLQSWTELLRSTGQDSGQRVRLGLHALGAEDEMLQTATKKILVVTKEVELS